MPAETDTPREKAVVLVVEDEPVLRTLFAEGLAEEGFEVLEAARGCDALHTARSTGTHIDVIVTDIRLPDIAGPDLIRAARKVFPNLRVVYISGSLTDPMQPADGAPMAAFLQKPFSLGTLCAQIRTLLDDKNSSFA